ncbi:MAG: bifunctional demethylmenaquinone methyltransferase/2-methoxy-6-polyprenyl-1,4-benzoquinol methylase [Alphaproteobacteria bacterium]|nr:bifunctional demethylmenaquinone methyltransferase/2-methoxy-6-polyprenyl-1,4-benzoquinol methylase [Alphaproteobacteria bacterium]HCP00754.1 bifunctional demethylmenaquinone methyltransferase/2-methoxy-6-polyprenyl-1,4-benzoquinol methylase [Rhodospirillaceae bacterium]
MRKIGQKLKHDTTHFGFENIPRSEKSERVRDVFSSVASNYDLMNDLMSFGVHRFWKSVFVEMITRRPNLRVLDVAGGTGDIAFRIQTKARPGTRITICDINAEMLTVGRKRALDRGILGREDGVRWVCGDAEAIPVPDASFDVYAIAFGMRNVTNIPAALSEARRILRPGGQFLCLEFSRVVLPILDQLYDRYSFSVLPWLGKRVARNESAYRYLAESIRKFPDQGHYANLIGAAGLDQVCVRNLSGGIAAIHSARRI